MSKRQFKSSASAARAFSTASPAFGFSASPGFVTTSSALSYLNELPGLSSISDSNVVVAFKNLSKRDATTKSKALEDLQGLLITDDKEIEDAVLDAWTNIYSRTSIENSRRVRQLAHTLQGHVVAKSGKRIAKRMPSVIGAWLAGLYDGDKAVARAASDALSQVFRTAEKRQALWKVYQDPLLDFCRDVFDKESPQTLSDERSVSPDEANMKYYRVVTSAIGLLSALVSESKEEVFKNNVAQYTEMFQDKRLWEKALSGDAAVRRATHKMLQSFLQSARARPCLDLSVLSKIYLSEGLNSDQTGSAREFLDAVIALTETDGTVWIGQWQDKKPPLSRLNAFVQRGSQGSALNFWAAVLKLFKSLPEAELPRDAGKVRELIESFYSGVTRKDEPRPFVVEGLKAYIQVAVILSRPLAEKDGLPFLRDAIMPMISQYLLPKPDKAKWHVPANVAQQLMQEVIKSKELRDMLLNAFPDLSAELVQAIKLSLPEQASEYARSQDDLSKAGQRFADLIAAVIHHVPEEESQFTLEKSIGEVLRESLCVLLSRIGKPYGAAAVAAAIIQQCRALIDYSDLLSSIVEDFLEKHIAMIYVSPSCQQLAEILSSCEDQKEVFEPAWTRCLNAVLADESDRRYEALAELLICRKDISETELQHLGPLLAPEILSKVDDIWATDGEWGTILQLLSKSKIATKLFGEIILDHISKSLVDSPMEERTALKGLRGMSKSCQNEFVSSLSTDNGKKLLSNLLMLSEVPDEMLGKEAKELIPVIQGLIGSDIASGSSGNAVLDVIQDGLNTAGPNSVSVDTLVNHAKGLLDSKMIESLASLLPDAKSWWKALENYFGVAPDRSLAMTSPLSGAVYLIIGDSFHKPQELQRDYDGFSPPLRMAMYTVKLCSLVPETLNDGTAELFEPLTFTTLLANDHLSIDRATNLWSHRDIDILNEVSDFVADGQRLISSWYDALIVKEPNRHLITNTTGLTAKAYYAALAKIRLVSEWVERQGSTSLDVRQLEDGFKATRRSGTVLSVLVHLLAHRTALFASPVVVRYCNELVADLTVLQVDDLQHDGFTKLVTLDAILNNYEDIGETIAKPRLSRFVSKAVSWLTDESVNDDLVAEIYRILIPLLPLVSDMYGDYWKSILESIKSILELVSELPDPNAPAIIPALHASLRLYGVLRRIKLSESSKPEDEQSDDVVEAWNDAESGINTAMINTLKVPRNMADEQHQPLMIFNELLSREISRIPTSALTAIEELYPQLYSPSPAVQQAAYQLLHRYIPSKQEQISLDTALDKTNARLPDELLSLILEAPSASNLHSEDFERYTPLQLRGYLLSWLLIFDHFTNASHKVKNDYVESMKETGHLSDFLDFTFDFLGHGNGKPIDVSKLDVASYNSSAMKDRPLKDTQWLLTHLYYLCLTHFPSSSKKWWIECQTRQKVISVESWTAKFISPLVISTALETVASWSATQEQTHTSEEPPPLVIRINHRASELTAAYPMDDEGQSAAIIISLPPTFPLHNAKVTSPFNKFMAVDERRWNTWLTNSEAIIAFSNNSIIDGLLAWRRNMFGALKGQTECAICYSVVGEDGRVPSKKCRTCRNSFHGGCLLKWFRSSNGTSCPLCRENFIYD